MVNDHTTSYKMTSRLVESDLSTHSETSEDLSKLSSHASRSVIDLARRFCLKQFSCSICLKSKPALLAVVWNVYIGALYTCLLNIFAVAGFIWQDSPQVPHHVNVVIWTVLSAYALLALCLMLYPVSGFLADVYCGRYKAVTISLIVLWVAMFFSSAATIMAYFQYKYSLDAKSFWVPFAIIASVSVLLMIVGLACYQANIVQLGLDQLLEAPSQSLGILVHWLIWAQTLGGGIIIILFSIFPCFSNSHSIVYLLGSLPMIFLIISTLLLAFTWYNHGWFYTEPGQHNPYKTVIKVLHFARKNKYPLRRSAFTYCDDFSQPSRIDFAKEIFGGPFTTPQVEDVKTFFRIVLVLFSLGPLFILEVPSSYYLFPLYALHSSNIIQFTSSDSCQSPAVWIIVQNGSIGFFASVLLIPVYIWITYSLLRNRIPKILHRLTCSCAIPLMGILYFLMTEIIGHTLNYHSNHHTSSGVCLFTTLYTDSSTNHTILNMHWSTTIPPSILFNFGFVLIQATALEFISAQSPHSMKGFLIGVFFAIKGLFQFIGAAAVVPFALPSIWDHVNALTNCGFGYYLFTLVVALIGVAVFSIVVRRYKYRQRDERPYDARFVERYYERYIGLGSSYGISRRGSKNISSGEEQRLLPKF